MLVGVSESSEEGVGRSRAIAGIRVSRDGIDAAMQLTLYKDATAPTATGAAVELLVSQV